MNKIYKNLSEKSSSKRAFTLAEVLITLGIIGVVAAVTIPTLVKNYQRKAWISQLQKSVSIIERGFQLAMADNDIMEFENTKLFQSLGENGSSQDNEAFFNEFKNYFKVIKIKESGFNEYDGYKLINGNGASSFGNRFANAIYLADGSKLLLRINNNVETKNTATCNRIKELGGNLCSRIVAPYFDIDVNGDKAPNQVGRDRFSFVLGNNGKLYPLGGKDSALYDSQTALSNNSQYWNSSNVVNWVKCAPKDSRAGGWGCTGRVFESGWKMDY